MSTSNPEFPATNILGYGLDFTAASPMDIKSVLAAIQRANRIIAYDPKDTRQLEVDGVMYDVPRAIAVNKSTTSDGAYVTYSTGTKANESLIVDTSLSARYLALSAKDSLSSSIGKTFRREDQWAMYSFNADTYLSSLQDYKDLLAEGPLANKLSSMVPIGDGSTDSTVQQYKEFFSSFGSHTIVNAGYGARFQLNVWAPTSNSAVNERFAVSVAAKFRGIPTGGKFDSSVTSEPQYKTFSELVQKSVSILGGDPVLNSRLTMDPTDYKQYVDWAASVATSSTVAKNSTITGLEVTELWTLMKDASNPIIQAAAPMVMDAYNWLVQHPHIYKTEVSLDIQSDWAEFNLLSPSAVIIPDNMNPWPDKTVAANTRVQWGKDFSHQYAGQKLKFFVINDGSPVDFSTSHGSNGPAVGQGKAIVTVNGKSYVSDKVTDNVWNTAWVYSAPVSATPAETLIDLIGVVRPWNDVLKLYLTEIGFLDWL